MSLAVIGGTGLMDFLDGETLPAGHNSFGQPSAAIIRSSVNGKPVLFLARHGNPHVVPPHKINYRANVFALKAAGATEVLAINSVGGIDASLEVGSLVVPHQLVDYTYGREQTFFDGEHMPLSHIDFTEPFSPTLRKRVVMAMNNLQLPVVDNGVCAVMQGPRLETAAEIDRLERDGCTVVGMTAMPEAALARELELSYASVCVVVNAAAGRGDDAINMSDIERAMIVAVGQLRQLIERLCR